MEELRQWLIDKGFKIYDNPIVSQYNQERWYACKRTTSKRECSSNKKPVQIIVNPYTATMRHGIHENVIVDLTAEYMEVWWKLAAYSMSPDELEKKLTQIEKRLVKAWEAL